MKKIIAITASAVLLTAVSMSSFAEENTAKSAEDTCQEQAVKEMVAADKVADYVKACVEKLADENGMAPAAPAK